MISNNSSDKSGGVVRHGCRHASAVPYRRVRTQDLYRCTGCGLVFEHPIPSAYDLEKIYDKTYYDAWGGKSDEDLVRKQKQAYFLQHIRNIRKIKKGGTLLDIGCAKGHFVELALREGYAAYGVELSEYSGNIAAQTVGKERILIGTLDRSSFSQGMFDVITMFDFLEHVPDLDSLFSIIRDIIKPGGLLFVVVPDISSMSYRIMGSHWWHFKEEHLFYFNKKSLAKTMQSNGFKVLESGVCKKVLSLEYIINQFKTYRLPVVTPIILAADKILPSRLRKVMFPLTLSGEIHVMASRE